MAPLLALDVASGAWLGREATRRAARLENAGEADCEGKMAQGSGIGRYQKPGVAV